MLLAALFGTGIAHAQPSAEGPRSLSATRLGDGERVRLDGRLDEPVWSRAVAAGDFVQAEPAPGEAASERTEVRVLYDGRALYVAVQAYAQDPGSLVRRLVRRDDFSDLSDRVFVEIGSPSDGRTAFSFGVNLAGARQDARLTDDRNTGDLTWDPVWDSAVRAVEGPEAGYIVEMRIPFSQLRFDADSDRPWEFNVQRDIASTGEIAYWSPVLPEADGYVSQFGRLEGLEGLRPPRQVELLPYAASRVTREPGDLADPFYQETDLDPRIGLDARVGLTSGLTLSATVNPDFGQVEADPAVVNLSQFEVFFEERRPFFIEGSDAFDFGGTRGRAAPDRPTFFYSRRIGTEPAPCAVYPSEAVCAGTAGAYLDVPEVTPIAAATKVSGQAGAWTLGLLDAVTLEQDVRFFVPVDGELGRAVSPLANYLVGRAERAWRGGRTVAGGFVSSVVRDASDNVFTPVFASSATVGGADVEVGTPSRAWTLSAVAAGSVVQGDASVIEGLQRAPQRYFQRADATYLDVDPEAEALSGYRLEAAVAKTGGGRNWRGSMTLGATSPGFEVNDLGFQQRADLLSANWEARYNAPNPRLDVLNYATVFAYGATEFNYGGDWIGQDVNLGSFVRFSNLWGAQVIGTYRPTYLNDRLTRGGALAERPADVSVSTFLGSNGAKRLFGSVSFAARAELPHDYENVGTEWTRVLRLRMTYRPTDAVTLAFEPDWTSANNTDQYRGSEAAAAGEPGAIGGRRYLFLDYRLERLDVGLRADWAFTPTLTLQVVAVPQVDAFRFGDVRALAEAESYDFVPYTGSVSPFGDFTQLSLRGNAVLRWEWRPGSTFFAVWQQLRDEREGLRGLDVLSDVGDVFSGDLTNVFLLKASYWFGL